MFCVIDDVFLLLFDCLFVLVGVSFGGMFVYELVVCLESLYGLCVR